MPTQNLTQKPYRFAPLQRKQKHSQITRIIAREDAALIRSFLKFGTESEAA